ncbi:hypothetical protein ACVDFE_28045 [Lentzea chajnantorensis]
MDEDEFTVPRVVADTLAGWDELRRDAGRAGDEQFRRWYFDVVSTHGDPHTFAFLTFETAVELLRPGACPRRVPVAGLAGAARGTCTRR